MLFGLVNSLFGRAIFAAQTLAHGNEACACVQRCSSGRLEPTHGVGCHDDVNENRWLTKMHFDKKVEALKHTIH